MMKNFFVESTKELKVGDKLVVELCDLRESISAALNDAEADLVPEKEDEEKVLFKDAHIYNVAIDEKVLEDKKKELEESDDDDVDASLEFVVEVVITEELLDKDIRQNINEYVTGRKCLRIAAAKRGYGLDVLCEDIFEEVRIEVVRQNYRLDKMITDDYSEVRVEVAKMQYGLDTLIKDDSSYVRAEVARQGYGLDTLVKDSNSYVRAEVAKQGYGHEILVEDASEIVRIAVAEAGYGHEILMNDEDRDVRVAVAESTSDGELLEILVRDENEHVKEAVARRKYGFPILLEKDEEGKYKNSGYVRAEVARNAQDDEEVKAELSADENYHVRLEIAKLGYAPLLKDPNAKVRKAAYEAIHKSATVTA